MSDAVWPVFEDGHKHSLCDEGAPVLRASDDLDAIATAAGRMPLSAFDEHADVPAEVFARLAEEAWFLLLSPAEMDDAGLAG